MTQNINAIPVQDYIFQSSGISTDGSFDNNLLGRNYFQFAITRIPNFQRFVRSVTVPTITYAEIPQLTQLNTNIKYPGGELKFEPLSIEYVVDERFFTYMELYGWLETISKISDNSIIGPNLQTSDASLLIMNSAYRAQKKITFKGLYPISLGPLEFTSIEPSSGPIVASATFNYTYFEVEEL